VSDESKPDDDSTKIIPAKSEAPSQKTQSDFVQHYNNSEYSYDGTEFNRAESTVIDKDSQSQLN